MIQLCEYGCGKEAKFQMTSNKWCCENFYTKCQGFKKKNPGNTGYKCSDEKKQKISNGNKGKIISEKTKEKLRNRITTEETKQKLRGKSSWCKGLTKETNIILFNNSEKLKKSIKKLYDNGRIPWNKNLKNCFTKESLKKISVASSRKKHSDEFKEKMRNKMRNGWCKYISKFIKKISKPEMKLRELIKEIYSNCEPQYPILNYLIDIAIPEFKIAIEYDGYYHFDTEEHKEYHKKRQEEIEKEGWKFYRVTMFDKFPTIEQVKENINSIKENN